MSAKLVLASISESRRRLLKGAGVVFEALAPEADEEAAKRELSGAPAAIAARLAELKALSISKRMPDAFVLGADQLLVCEGKIYGKARDQNDARRILRELRGRKHELITASVLAKSGTIIWRHNETAALWMRDFSDRFLEAYLNEEKEVVRNLAGCYRVEGLGAQLFSRIEGDHYAIQGLPLLAVLEALRHHGVITP